MALKRAKFITYGADPICDEIQKFVEEAGFILDKRNLAEKPFTYDELKKMIGYLDVNHFLNPMAPAYSKKNFDKALPAREELFQVLAEDNSILRKPIIQTPRLMTVGCNKQKIMEMLQLSNSSYSQDNNNGSSGSSNNNRNNHRRHTNSKNSSKEAVSGK